MRASWTTSENVCKQPQILLSLSTGASLDLQVHDHWMWYMCVYEYLYLLFCRWYSRYSVQNSTLGILIQLLWYFKLETPCWWLLDFVHVLVFIKSTQAWRKLLKPITMLWLYFFFLMRRPRGSSDENKFLNSCLFWKVFNVKNIFRYV